MEWRMMGAAAAAGVFFVSTAFADYIARDLVGGCATEGDYPNTETRMPGTIEEALAESRAEGYTVRNAGHGRYDVYYEGCLEGYLKEIKEVESGGSGSGGGNPAASSSIAVNQIIRQDIFTQAQPKPRSQKSSPPAQPDASTTEATQPSFDRSFGHSGRLKFGAADVFFNKWEIGDEDGETFGINPSITWGETQELTMTVPVHIINGDDDTIFGVGLDGAYKIPFRGRWENFAAGVHAYGMGFFGGDDNASTFGGGPFISFNYRIDPKWILSLGGLLELTKPDDDDLITEVVPGVNLGYNLTDNVALNGYGIYYRNMDSDADDEGYVDLGGDVRWVMGGWALSAGAKTAVGMKDVTSTEIYLGSEWIF